MVRRLVIRYNNGIEPENFIHYEYESKKCMKLIEEINSPSTKIVAVEMPNSHDILYMPVDKIYWITIGKERSE